MGGQSRRLDHAHMHVLSPPHFGLAAYLMVINR